jgi:hypothetical protein
MSNWVSKKVTLAAGQVVQVRVDTPDDPIAMLLVSGPVPTIVTTLEEVTTGLVVTPPVLGAVVITRPAAAECWGNALIITAGAGATVLHILKAT